MHDFSNAHKCREKCRFEIGALTEILQLEYGFRGFLGEKVNGVLITEPVGCSNRVVHVIKPMIVFDAADGRIDATLSRDRVRSSWEKLCYHRHFEALVGEAQSCSQTGSAGAHDDAVVAVLYYFVLRVKFINDLIN